MDLGDVIETFDWVYLWVGTAPCVAQGSDRTIETVRKRAKELQDQVTHLRKFGRELDGFNRAVLYCISKPAYAIIDYAQIESAFPDPDADLLKNGFGPRHFIMD